MLTVNGPDGAISLNGFDTSSGATAARESPHGQCATDNDLDLDVASPNHFIFSGYLQGATMSSRMAGHNSSIFPVFTARPPSTGILIASNSARRHQWRHDCEYQRYPQFANNSAHTALIYSAPEPITLAGGARCRQCNDLPAILGFTGWGFPSRLLRQHGQSSGNSIVLGNFRSTEISTWPDTL